MSAGTSSLRLTGHSWPHAAQYHSRFILSPLMFCCSFTPGLWHDSHAGGTRRAMGVSGKDYSPSVRERSGGPLLSFVASSRTVHLW